MQIPFVFLECRYLLCRITTAAIQLCICLMSVFVYPTTSSTTASYDVRVSGANGCCGHIDYVLRELLSTVAELRAEIAELKDCKQLQDQQQDNPKGFHLSA